LDASPTKAKLGLGIHKKRTKTPRGGGPAANRNDDPKLKTPEKTKNRQKILNEEYKEGTKLSLGGKGDRFARVEKTNCEQNHTQQLTGNRGPKWKRKKNL